MPGLGWVRRPGEHSDDEVSHAERRPRLGRDAKQCDFCCWQFHGLCSSSVVSYLLWGVELRPLKIHVFKV